MKTIRFKNDTHILISVSDVCSYIKSEINLTDKQTSLIEWDFIKESVKDLHESLKSGLVSNSLNINGNFDYFICWTRFWRMKKLIKKPLNKNIIDLFLLLDSPEQFEINPLFEEI
jgi:hypothetical protein